MSEHDIPTQRVRELAELTETKKKLEAEVKKVAARISSLQESLLKNFSAGEVPSIKVLIKGGEQRTVSLRRQLWASSNGDIPGLVRFLQANDLEELTTYSPQKLTSYVREHDVDGRRLDKGLAALVRVSEVFTLRVTKS